MAVTHIVHVMQILLLKIHCIIWTLYCCISLTQCTY